MTDTELRELTKKQAKALKLALEALEWINRVNAMDYEYKQKARETLNAIYEALALVNEVDQEQPAQQEPYGQVTVVRRPGCVDQHWFYRWPEPPYRDNAAECHTVYTSPPASKPLTDEQIMAIGKELGLKCRLGGNPNIDFDYARAIEAAHGIKENT